jgi:hypothetical protein
MWGRSGTISRWNFMQGGNLSIVPRGVKAVPEEGNSDTVLRGSSGTTYFKREIYALREWFRRNGMQCI